MLTRDWAVGTAVELLSLAQRGSQHSRRDAAPLAAGCALSAKSIVPELILFGRRVPVDGHGAGSGRNLADPVTRHRNTGCCSERVAHFLRGLHEPLWLCRAHYVFARISGKCRCAKCEYKHDTCGSNRRTAQATKPVFYSHAVIVIPFRISRKLIQRRFKTKKDTFNIANQSGRNPRRPFAAGVSITSLGTSTP